MLKGASVPQFVYDTENGGEGGREDQGLASTSNWDFKVYKFYQNCDPFISELSEETIFGYNLTPLFLTTILTL